MPSPAAITNKENYTDSENSSKGHIFSGSYPFVRNTHVICTSGQPYSSGSIRRQRSDEHRIERRRNLTMGGEYKQPKNVIEQEKPVFWTWYVDAGYESEYNFRGTNLTPNANGAGFFNARVTKWNFTLGLFGIHQFGHASGRSWSIGEGGGSAGARPEGMRLTPWGSRFHTLASRPRSKLGLMNWTSFCLTNSRWAQLI